MHNCKRKIYRNLSIENLNRVTSSMIAQMLRGSVVHLLEIGALYLKLAVDTNKANKHIRSKHDYNRSWDSFRREGVY